MCTFQKKSGRGWNNKAQVQDGIAPTNDTNAPFHLKSGRGSKESKAQVGWGMSLNPVVLHKKQLDDPDIGIILKWKESGQRPFGPTYVPQALQPDTIGIGGSYYRYKMAC